MNCLHSRVVRPTGSRGFTVIELLAVIAVISVLAALLLPVLFAAKAKGAQASCISNLHQLGSAIGIYVQDYDELLPFAPSCGTRDLILDGHPQFGEPLDTEILYLPDIKVVLRPYGAVEMLFRCPWDHTNSALNYKKLPTWYEISGSSYHYNDWDGLRSTSITGFSTPSSTFLMGDGECFHDAVMEGCGFFDVLHMDLHVKPLTTAQREDALNNVLHDKR